MRVLSALWGPKGTKHAGVKDSILLPEKGRKNLRVLIRLVQIESSVFVSLALVLQATNIVLLFVGGKRKGHRQGRPIDCSKESYLAGGLSRMSGITTGDGSGNNCHTVK